MMTIRCVLVALLATAAVAAPAPDCPVTDCLHPCPDGVYMKDGCPTCDCITDVEFCTVALCPTGTLCDNDRRECVPFACSLPVCEEECEYGFIFDDAGCPLCECAPDPCEDANCPTGTGCVVRLIAVQCIRAPCPSIYQAECVDPNVLKDGSCPPNDVIGICVVPDNACIGDGQCPGDEKCCSFGCNRVCLPPVKDEDCEELDCLEEARETCPNGVVTVFGCPTCQCQDEAPFCTRALCPVGTRCDDTLQACVPLEACPPVCAIFCEFGKVLDANGCETCECNPDPCWLIDCAPGYTCDPDVGECVPEECEPELCKVRCEFGFALDDNGCEFCQCRIDPCATVRCGFGTVCVARRVDVLCIRAPCPPQFEVSCVDPAPKPGSCPTVLSLLPCTDPNAVAECMYDTECRGDYKCCDDGICGVMRCTAPQVSCRPLRCRACRAGHVMVDGCPTCECINPCAAIDCAPGYTCDENTGRCEQVGPRCLPVRCDATCQLTLDENDCEICSCSRDPCATQICRRNYHCEVTRGDQARCVPDLVLRRRTSG